MRPPQTSRLYRSVRKNISIAGLLLAWLCANGAVWDVVQVFAWGRMFAANTETMSVTAALRATFDPGKRCQLCVSVARAKDTTQKQAPLQQGRTTEKLLLACEAPAKIIFAHSPGEWPRALTEAAPVRFDPVPVPPPRV